MKTCKKCKKQVANSVKICPGCGRDLSNASINKSNKSTKKKNNTKPIKNNEKEEVELLFDKSKNNLEKTEVLFTKEEINDLKEKIEEIEEVDDSTVSLTPDNYSILFGNKVKLEKKAKIKEVKVKINELKSKTRISKKKDKKEQEKEELLEEVVIKKTRAQKIKDKKRKLKIKKILYAFFLCSLFLVIISLGKNIIVDFENRGYVVTEKEHKTFNMGDVINYKGVRYKVVSVETSMGTSYKKPKEGNQYLIITINMENKSNTKYRYSSEDWTVCYSKDEETKRIISPINAGNSLYTGYLVVGGTKEASLVFEVPENDDNMRIRYYDPELVEEKEEIDDSTSDTDNTESIDSEESDKEKEEKSLPKGLIFSVKLKIPKTE